MSNFTALQKNSHPVTIILEQPSAEQQITAMDVYGQQIEPICNYRTCHHKFSAHGHKCKCCHPINHALWSKYGISGQQNMIQKAMD
jgi:DNA-binding helix-hairpin-helix protein with protein kinase domain